MPIPSQQIGRLRNLDSRTGPQHLVLKCFWEQDIETWCLAVLLQRRPGGLLLCIPENALMDFYAQEAEEAHYANILGPAILETVKIPGDIGEMDISISAWILDLSNQAYENLDKIETLRSADTIPQDMLVFNADPAMYAVPTGASLQLARTSWMQQFGADNRATDYFSTLETKPPAARKAESRAVAKAASAAAEPPPQVQVFMDQMAAMAKNMEDMQKNMASMAMSPAAPPPKAIASRQLAGSMFMNPALGKQSLHVPPPPGRMQEAFDLPPSQLAATVLGDDGLADDTAYVDAQDGSGNQEDLGTAKISQDAKMASMMMKAMERQTAALLAATGRREEDLLSTGSSSAAGSSRGAAALEQQRMEMASQPSKVVASIRSTLATAMRGDPTQPQDADLYFTRFGRFTREMREPAMVTSIFAQIWNLMEQGRMEEAQAMVGASLAAMDQWSISKTLDPGYLWLRVPEPAYGPQAHTATTRLQPYSRLAPPKWAVAVSAYLSDMEKLNERLQPKKTSPNVEPKTPWRPKAQKGQKGEAKSPSPATPKAGS